MDIVDRLRDTGDHARFEPSLHHEAADEIERLRGLFLTDGEQHADHIKGLTERHAIRIQKYLAEIERLRVENEHMKTLLKMLVDLCNRGDFRNGNTDPTGQMDEGDYWAGQIIDYARAALGEEKPFEDRYDNA